MKVQRIGLALALALGMVGLAQANPVAMLYKVQGKVMVNQGGKFVEAKAGMPLGVGDRILVMAGSDASIEYGNGCTLSLAPNSSLTVTPDCKNALAVTGTQQDNTAMMDPSHTDYTPYILIGGIATVALIAAASGGGNGYSTPMSP